MGRGIILRRESVKARDVILRRLNDQLWAAMDDNSDAKQPQIEQIIQEVKQERSGSFRPLAEDPVLQAIAIPFGGVGGLVLIEQLLSQV